MIYIRIHKSYTQLTFNVQLFCDCETPIFDVPLYYLIQKINTLPLKSVVATNIS